MIGKSLLAVASALALSSFATAGEQAKVEWKVGGAAAPVATAPVLQKAPASAFRAQKSEAPVSRKEMQVVAQVMKAQAEKNAGGKPSEQPKQQASTAGAQGGHRVVPAEMKVVAMAMKAQAEKNAGGKPSEQPKQPVSTAGGQSGHQVAPAEMKVVEAAARAHAERNANGRPSETPRSPSGSWSRERSSFRGGFEGGRGERSLTFRGAPMERLHSHCNARGMCF